MVFPLLNIYKIVGMNADAKPVKAISQPWYMDLPARCECRLSDGIALTSHRRLRVLCGGL